jgi:broad specificity phosphatase PhoE
VILVRHGQSEWNAVFGQTRIDPQIPDPVLTADGCAQAGAVAESLAVLGIERLLVSPYRRTLQTASIIAERLQVTIAIEPLVREQAAFSCDIGTPRSKLAALWPQLCFDHLDEVWWSSSRESEEQLRLRCSRFSTVMRAAPDWSHVAVITHWAFIRGLTGVEARNGQLVSFDPYAGTGPAAIEPAPVPC